MSGAPPVHILPGRHQPPHLDHLRVIRRALELVEGELYVGLIVSPPTRGAPDTDFERAARPHHDPERSPYSFVFRHRLLSAALDDLLDPVARARVHLVALPRPEAAFELVAAMFPERRRWVVPEVGEAFDEAKAAFFRERGDLVLRVPLSAQVCGWAVRRMVEAEAWRALEDHAPPSVIRLLREERARRLST